MKYASPTPLIKFSRQSDIEQCIKNGDINSFQGHFDELCIADDDKKINALTQLNFNALKSTIEAICEKHKKIKASLRRTQLYSSIIGCFGMGYFIGAVIIQKPTNLMSIADSCMAGIGGLGGCSYALYVQKKIDHMEYTEHEIKRIMRSFEFLRESKLHAYDFSHDKSPVIDHA